MAGAEVATVNLTADGSIDQERILASEWITPSLCLPPECRGTGSAGWLTAYVWHWASSEMAFEAFDRSKQITVIAVYHLGFDLWLQNDKSTRESKVMHNQSVPLWQMEESCIWAKTKGCTQDLYKLLHLCGIAQEKKNPRNICLQECQAAKADLVWLRASQQPSLKVSSSDSVTPD